MPCDKNDDTPKQQPEGLFAQLVKSRTILLAGEVDQELAEKVIGQLLILDGQSNDPIKMIITTQGGHVDSGFAIHDIMRFIKSPVYAIGAGWVASIGVPIFLGAAKKYRYSLPNTRYLLHQPMGGAVGAIKDIRIEAQEILKIRTKINDLLAAETGQAVDRIKEDSDRNFWMSAEEAKEYGLVTKIVDSVDDLG